MKSIALPGALLFVAGCAVSSGPQPESYGWQSITVSDDEKTKDPVAAANALIEAREKPGSLDRAIALLNYHLGQKPQSAELHRLLAEAHSRTVETLDLSKPEDRAPHEHHRTEGLKHAEEAVKLAPDNGGAHYWLACLLLHAADAERSLGRANAALKQLDTAEKLDPKVDQGGPARMRGKVLHEMPGLFGGSTSKAIESFKKSLEVAPDSSTTHLWLGQAYADSKKNDLAQKELQWVVAAKPRPGHEKEDAKERQTAEELLKKIGAK